MSVQDISPLTLPRHLREFRFCAALVHPYVRSIWSRSAWTQRAVPGGTLPTHRASWGMRDLLNQRRVPTCRLWLMANSVGMVGGVCRWPAIA
jgi:hypothetical protein